MAKPFKRIMWTLERAASEFNINPRTLSARMKQAGIEYKPGSGWTTLQVVRGIYNDLESERIRKTRAEADQVELQNAEAQGRLVDIEEFAKRWESKLVNMVRIIRSSKLTDAEQDDILRGLANEISKNEN